MNTKKIFTVSLLLFVAASIVFLIAKESGGGNPPGRVEAKSEVAPGKAAATNPTAISAKTPGGKPDKIIVYYFHGNARCPSCMKIEKFTSRSVEENFADDLKKGVVEWKVVNVDEPKNQHFVKDYQLVTKSVVLSMMKGGKEIGWKNLDKVWDLIGNEGDFKKYVKDGVKSAMEGNS